MIILWEPRSGSPAPNGWQLPTRGSHSHASCTTQSQTRRTTTSFASLVRETSTSSWSPHSLKACNSHPNAHPSGSRDARTGMPAPKNSLWSLKAQVRSQSNLLWHPGGPGSGSPRKVTPPGPYIAIGCATSCMGTTQSCTNNFHV